MAIFPWGVLCGIVAVLTFDTAGSFASRRLKFPYARLAPISCLIWACVAAIASQAGAHDLIESIGLGGLAGLIIGLVDSTLGWWISWHVGPGRLPPQLITRYKIVRIIFSVTMMAAVVGVAASLLRRLVVELMQK